MEVIQYFEFAQSKAVQAHVSPGNQSGAQHAMPFPAHKGEPHLCGPCSSAMAVLWPLHLHAAVCCSVIYLPTRREVSPFGAVMTRNV